MCTFTRLKSVLRKGALFILGFLAWMFARVSYCGFDFPQVVSVGWINTPTKCM